MRGRGELGDIDRGLVVRGVGGSTGCPECRGLVEISCRRGKECGKKKKRKFF